MSVDAETASPAGDPRKPRPRRVLELVALFALGPVLLALAPRWLVTLGILGAGVLCLVVLLLDPTFARGRLLDAAALGPDLGRTLRRVAIVWAGLLAATVVFLPGALFQFPRTRPAVWAVVMVLYPISAYAQEIMFRTFFFHRYASLLRGPRARVLASGLLFGWAHVAVNNLAAVALASVGGLLFAWTYERSRSTLLVTLEHALYGDFVFTVGLGPLFYSAARWVG